MLKGQLLVLRAGGVDLAQLGSSPLALVAGTPDQDTDVGATFLLNLGPKLSVRLVAGLVPVQGNRLFLSDQAGLATTTAPVAGPIQELGYIDNPSLYESESTVRAILVRLHEVG